VYKRNVHCVYLASQNRVRKSLYSMDYKTPHDVRYVDTASIVCSATVHERERTASAILGRRHFERCFW